jgi:hypothetical protein
MRWDGEFHEARYKIGYARVSTLDQNLALQALKEAACDKIFNEQMSGAVTDRPALLQALEYARSGDTLILWKLDRLARSMKQLVETIERLRLRGIGLRSITEAIDMTKASWCFTFSARSRSSSALSFGSAHEGPAMSMVAVFVGACAAASAVFMILGLSSPYSGVFRALSCSAPTRAGGDGQGVKTTALVRQGLDSCR